MNKKGDFITLSIIFGIILLVGFIYIEDKLGKKEIKVNYVGDSSTGVVYNIRSNNSNCNLDGIHIVEENIRYFENVNQIPEGYTLDSDCY